MALAVLRELGSGVLERSRESAGRLRQGLEALTGTGKVVQVRGRGMLLGLVLRGIDAGEVGRGARERGLLVNPIGADVVRLAPPLTLSAAEAAEAVERLGAAIAAAPAKE